MEKVYNFNNKNDFGVFLELFFGGMRNENVDDCLCWWCDVEFNGVKCCEKCDVRRNGCCFIIFR